MENTTSFIDSEPYPIFLLLTTLFLECYEKDDSHSQFVRVSEIDTGLYCPRMFDGYVCWDETPAGAVAFQQCPFYVIGLDPRRYVYKECLESGVWFSMYPGELKPWTNYTSCVDFEELDDTADVTDSQERIPDATNATFTERKEFRIVVNRIYVAGYSISAISLVLSLIIFLYFRSLQCTRIRIHMHLFASFAITNLIWILWYETVVINDDVIMANEVWCQVLHVITHYFMLTGFFWMFCEGLHLYLALVVVFANEDAAMLWLAPIGWGIPFLITAIYSTIRYLTPGATERCWMDFHTTLWIVIVPVYMSLIASFVFLVNVMRVVVSQLHPAPHQHVAATMKVVKAALILIPLLGLHFALIPIQPSPGSAGERVYQVVSAILTSFQGLCVSVLFCFTNNEVVTAIKVQLTRRRNQNEVGIPMAGVVNKETSRARRATLLSTPTAGTAQSRFSRN